MGWGYRVKSRGTEHLYIIESKYSNKAVIELSITRYFYQPPPLEFAKVVGCFQYKDE